MAVFEYEAHFHKFDRHTTLIFDIEYKWFVALFVD